MSKRSEKRRDKAEEVCKEVRKQIANKGRVYDNNKVCHLLYQWLKYGIKDSYKETKLPNEPEFPEDRTEYPS